MRYLLCGLLGVLLGVLLHATLGVPSPALVAAAAAPASSRCDIDWLRMRGEMHSVVRDTLITTLHAEAQRGLASSAAQPSAATPVRPPAPAATPDQQRAFADHAALLAAATQRGTWTDADVQRSRELRVAMNATDRSAALSALTKAINDRRLKVQAVPPL